MDRQICQLTDTEGGWVGGGGRLEREGDNAKAADDFSQT